MNCQKRDNVTKLENVKNEQTLEKSVKSSGIKGRKS